MTNAALLSGGGTLFNQHGYLFNTGHQITRQKFTDTGYASYSHDAGMQVIQERNSSNMPQVTYTRGLDVCAAQMTSNNQRVNGGPLNNALGFIGMGNNGVGGLGYCGCGEQAKCVLGALDGVKCNDKWTFEIVFQRWPQRITPHHWVMAYPITGPGDPILKLDPWNDSITESPQIAPFPITYPGFVLPYPSGYPIRRNAP